MGRAGTAFWAQHICIVTLLATMGLAGIISMDGLNGTGGAQGALIVVDAGGGGNYTAIQDAVDNASSGDTIHVWAGTYDENVIVSKPLTIQGNGSATTTVDAGAALAGFVIASDWVNVTGFRVVNSTWGGSHYAGIFVHQSSHVTIHDCNLTDNRDGIRLIGSTHNHIHNNTASGNNVGIALVSGSDHNLVEFNVADDNGDYGIYTSGSDNNTIRNNTCGESEAGIALLSGSFYNRVLWNTCDDNVHTSPSAGHGIYLHSSHHNLVAHNHAGWNDRQGIHLDGSHHNDIIDNNCSNNNNGIVLLSSHHNDITYNDCKGNNDYGIYLSGSWSNDVNDNTCNSNEFGIGLFSTSENNTLEDNTCVSNTYSGIHLHSSRNNTIADNVASFDHIGISVTSGSCMNVIIGNTLHYNDDVGIYVYTSWFSHIANNSALHSVFGILMVGANHGTLIFNNCSHNEQGFRLNDCNWNTLANNTVAQNTDKGFNITSSSNNSLYHNDIINNSVQAHDSGGNTWDNGAGEGNYWSDYTGLDNGAGNRTAGDGIGDTNIPHLSLDHYPFINTSGWSSPGSAALSPPGAPDAQGGFTLSWSAVPRALGYILQEDGRADFPSPDLLYNGPETSFEITDRSDGDYYYRVQAYNDQGKGPWSGAVKVTVDLPPAKVKGLAAEPLSRGNAVAISWTPNTADTSSYLIEYSVNGTGAWEVLAEPDHPVSSYGHDGLTDGLTLAYRVSARDGAGQLSGPSAKVEATPGDTLAPAPPGGVMVDDPACACLTVLWAPSPEDDVTGYHVYRSLSADGEFERVTEAPTDRTSYVDFGLKEDTSYHYAVTAQDEVPNESGLSASAKGKTILGPYAPVVVSPPGNITIEEDSSDGTSIDLSSWFSDPNGDELTFAVSGGEHIGVTFFRAGDGVLLTPEEDWSGEETLTFTASDGVLNASGEVPVTVTPVNDPPDSPVITSPADGLKITEGKRVDLRGECLDADTGYGDELAFAWSSAISGHLGGGAVVEGVALPAGVHTICLVVTDSAGFAATDQVTVTVIAVEVQGPAEGDFGVEVRQVGDMVLTQGQVSLVVVVLGNTGTMDDILEVDLSTGGLEDDVRPAANTGDIDVPAGGTVEYSLYVSIPDAAAPGDCDVTVTVRSIRAGENGFVAEDTMSFTIQVLEKEDTAAVESGGASPSGPWSGFPVLLLFGIASAIVATAPWWYLGLMFLFAPLMVRLRKGDDDRKWRDKIFFTIASKPGIHFTGIKGWLDISNGTLVYNLEVLIKEGRIVSRRDGFFKRYYPVESELDRKPTDSMSMEEKIAIVVRDNPGAAQSEVSHVLDEGWSKVHYHVRKMEEKGVLSLEPNADGHPRLYLTEGKKGEEMKRKVFGKTLTGEEKGEDGGEEVGAD